MKKQKRLTFTQPNGNFGVVGMIEENAEQKIYACVVKLRDYENTDFSPEELMELRKILDKNNYTLSKLIAEIKQI